MAGKPSWFIVEEGAMPLLHTALQEGFAGDAVVLRVNGREVFHREGVQTRRQIGLAATHEEQLPAGPITIEVSLPERQLTEILPLSLSHDTYLGVSVNPQGKLTHVISREPFGYV